MVYLVTQSPYIEHMFRPSIPIAYAPEENKRAAARTPSRSFRQKESRFYICHIFIYFQNLTAKILVPNIYVYILFLRFSVYLVFVTCTCPQEVGEDGATEGGERERGGKQPTFN